MSGAPSVLNAHVCVSVCVKDTIPSLRTYTHTENRIDRPNVTLAAAEHKHMQAYCAIHHFHK